MPKTPKDDDNEEGSFYFRIEDGNVRVRCTPIPDSRDIYLSFSREGRQFFRYRITPEDQEKLALNMDWAMA